MAHDEAAVGSTNYNHRWGAETRTIFNHRKNFQNAGIRLMNPWDDGAMNKLRPTSNEVEETIPSIMRLMKVDSKTMFASAVYLKL